ncbi:MAG: hypothetical protein GWN79_24160, partial [Actinobacteria bacterium]|nr:hypothetical protein [Actinomycetota bacterium]
RAAAAHGTAQGGIVMAGAFDQIVGKTVDEVIFKDNPSNPRQQVFLVFDDGTYFEIYGGEGDPIKGARGIDKGDADWIEQLGQDGQSVLRFSG